MYSEFIFQIIMVLYFVSYGVSGEFLEKLFCKFTMLVRKYKLLLPPLKTY